MSERLTKNEYWQSVYEKKGWRFFKMPRFLATVCYSEKILWENIYLKYLPKTSGLKILEIGSAPGGNLVKFHRIFGYEPFGVDYSQKGAELNRKKFKTAGLSQNNVIFADFMSDAFQRAHQERFDIAYSRGFIEHFSDTKEVVEKHLNVLSRGGYLIVIIPNLRGINYCFQRLFNKEVIAMHNLAIMDKIKFHGLFPTSYLEELYCNYFGTFNFGLFKDRRKIFDFLQWQLNLALPLLFGKRGFENRFSSPYLIYIGRKK